jgi:DNA-binding transcriptional MerR regulator
VAIIWPDQGNATYWRGSYLTTQGAAKALGVTPQTVRSYIKDKRFPNPLRKTEGSRHYFLFTKQKVIQFEDKIKELRGRG